MGKAKDNVNGKNKIELYYANWCGHCTRFKPVWEEMKPELEDMGVSCYEYEDSQDSAKVKAANVQGFPTIRVTQNGITADYDGPRTKEAIMSVFSGQGGGARQMDDDDDEEYYKMKYYKYKRKYLDLLKQI